MTIVLFTLATVLDYPRKSLDFSNVFWDLELKGRGQGTEREYHRRGEKSIEFVLFGLG